MASSIKALQQHLHNENGHIDRRSYSTFSDTLKRGGIGYFSFDMSDARERYQDEETPFNLGKIDEGSSFSTFQYEIQRDGKHLRQYRHPSTEETLDINEMWQKTKEYIDSHPDVEVVEDELSLARAWQRLVKSAVCVPRFE